jgi:hypothetical protein
VERCARWPAGQPPHVFIDVRKPRLDPCSPLFACAFQAACASYDFCRCMFPRARPRTARTSRTTGERLGRLPSDRKSPFDRGRPPKVRRVRGREHRVSTLSTAIARGRDFAPTPIASGTSCRGHPPLPCPERRGKKRMPPPRRTLAGRALRKGRATPDFREETRRSPTRGAFRRRAARGAGGSPASGQRAARGERQRLFHHRRNPHEGRSGGA